MIFSVIIPCYNSSAYLKDCLESFLNSKFKTNEFEVILVNDGSNDDTLIKLNYFNDNYSFIKVLSQKRNGVSSARNLGVENSMGKFILFLDSDDKFSTNIFEELNDQIKKIDFEILEFGYKFKNRKQIKVKNQDKPQNGYNHYLSNSQSNSVCNKLYKKSFLVSNKLFFDKKFKIGEDLLFNLFAMASAKRVVCLSKTLLLINDGNDNSVTRKKSLLTEKQIITDLYEIFKITSLKISDKNSNIEKRYYIKHSNRIMMTLLFRELKIYVLYGVLCINPYTLMRCFLKIKSFQYSIPYKF